MEIAAGRYRHMETIVDAHTVKKILEFAFAAKKFIYISIYQLSFGDILDTELTPGILYLL